MPGSLDASKAPASYGTPRYSVALVQSEIEMLNSPGNEVSAFLLADPSRWAVDVFTERTFEGALGAAAAYDCIVLGFNAVSQSDAIQQALRERRPESGLVVLHQLKRSGMDFLKGLGLSLDELEVEASDVEAPLHMDVEDEILLNWPEPVIDGLGTGRAGPAFAGSALCHLDLAEAGAWRTTLEIVSASTRRPVVIRSSSRRKPRVVICTLLLEPRRDAHARLLTNMITYAAGGWPEIAMLTEAGGAGRPEIARRLRIQGANVVELPPARPNEVRFTSWPLRGSREVIVPPGWSRKQVLACEGAGQWLELGGTFVLIDDEGVSFRHGASDTQMVAARWATWFHSLPSVRWHGAPDWTEHAGSIFATRAVLRVLSLLARPEIHAQPMRLGLDAPERFHREAVRLLAYRRKREFEHTVSTYAAALDILGLVGTTGSTARSLDRYLRRELEERFVDAAPEDMFDIARALGRADLFEQAVETLRARLPSDTSPISAVLVTRLREAAVATGVEPDLPENLDLLASADIESNLRLAGEYVPALVEFRERFPGNPAADVGTGLTRSLGTIARHGFIARVGEEGGEARLMRAAADEVCAEVSALVAYYNLHPTSTHPIRRDAQGVPAAMVEAVLTASNRAREAERAAMAQLPPLERARHVFGAIASLAFAGVFAAVLMWLGVDPGALGFAFLLASLAFVVLVVFFDRVGLSPGWATGLTSLMANGLSGVAGAIGQRLGKPRA